MSTSVWQTVSAFVLAGAVVSAVPCLMARPARADETRKRCYAVSFKGQKDRASGVRSGTESSTADFDPSSFKLIFKGTCSRTIMPGGRGSR